MLITIATAGTLATAAACSSGTASQSVNAPTRSVTATATHRATPQAVIYGCDAQPVGRPAALVLFCGDAGEVLQGLTWSGWGGPTATATGLLREKKCVPNCATGGIASYSATVTVSGLADGRYTSMHIVAPGAPDPSSDVRLGPNGPVVVPRR